MSFFGKVKDAFTDHKGSDAKETDLLYSEAEQAYAKTGAEGIDLEEVVEGLLSSWEYSEEKTIPTDARATLFSTGVALLRGCGLYSLPERPVSGDMDGSYRAREACRQLIPAYNNFEQSHENAQYVVLNIFHALLKNLPDSIFESEEDRSTTLISFPVPASKYLTNRIEISDDIVSWFFAEEVIDSPLFQRARNTIISNFQNIETRYNIKEGKLTSLADLNGKYPAGEVVPQALARLPFDYYLDFDIPVSLEGTDRFKHQYVLGKTGSGKSVALRYQLAKDIHAGFGVVVITPERALIDDVISYVPEGRHADVVYFDPSDTKTPGVGFNPFTLHGDDVISQKAGELEDILIRTLGDMGVKMRPVLSNTIYALLQGGGSFPNIAKLLDPTDSIYRQQIRNKLDERTQEFFTKYDESKYYKDVYEPVINRLDSLLRPPLSITLSTPSLDFPTLLNKKSSIVLCDLSRLRGFQAEVTGQLLVSTFQQTFFQRDFMPASSLLPYFFYMDEFQTYATSSEDSLRDFLTRSRKYKVGIVMAHQNTKDIPDGLLASIFGNCGTLFGMLMSADDAKRFTKEAQLQNFGDGSDKNASTQLQNFKPGEVAVSTPEIKKAQICRVPEYPPFERDFDSVQHIKNLTRALYGASPEPDEPQDPPTPPDQKEPTEPKPSTGWDDLGYEIS